MEDKSITIPEEIKKLIARVESGRSKIQTNINGDLISAFLKLRESSVSSYVKESIEKILISQLLNLSKPEFSEMAIELLAAGEKESLKHIDPEEITIAIIPGNTSTKVAAYKGTKLIAREDIPLSVQQNVDLDFRVNQIRTWLMNMRIPADKIAGISVKGGYLEPASGGTFIVDEEMAKDISNSLFEHASNLGVPIGLKLRERLKRENILLTTTDPISTDELLDSSRLLGVSGYFKRGSGAHYINHRSIAKILCALTERDYLQSDLISSHTGGGISTAYHKNGKMVDVMNSFSDMPGSNRAGNIPLEIVLNEIKSGRISIEELKRLTYTEGGLLSLAGTNDFKTVLNFRSMGSNQVQRDKINLILDFYIASIAKSIMSLSVYSKDAFVIGISGGLVRSEEIRERLKDYIRLPVPFVPFDDSFDIELLICENILSRIRPERLRDYSKEKVIFQHRLNNLKKTLNTKLFDMPVLRVKPQMPARCINDIIFMARERVSKFGCPRIGIVGGNNEEAIEAANIANSEGRFRIAKFLLIGPFAEISQIAWDYDIYIDNDNFTIVDAEDPVLKAMSLYKNGVANMLMKGSIMTEHIMRSFIETTKSMLPPDEKVFLSHVGVFEIPAYPKLLLISDAAINPAPNKNAKKKIIANTLSVAKALNIRVPKIAIISAVEKVNPSVQSSVEAREIAEEMSGSSEYIIEGPLSVDVAINPRIAQEKKYSGRIQGDADILIMPDIEAGNIIYKTLTVSSHARIAGVVVGGNVPLILTSRGDTSQSKLASISLGILLYTLSIMKGEEQCGEKST